MQFNNLPTGSDESTMMASYFPCLAFRRNSTADITKIMDTLYRKRAQETNKKKVSQISTYHHPHEGGRGGPQIQQLIEGKTSSKPCIQESKESSL